MQVQEELIEWAYFIPMLFALVFLFLGAFAMSLMQSENFGTLFRRFRRCAFLGSFIIVFVVVCIPIVMVSAAAYRESGDFAVLLISIVPIFSAGLALEEHADRIVGESKREAKQSLDAGNRSLPESSTDPKSE